MEENENALSIFDTEKEFSIDMEQGYDYEGENPEDDQSQNEDINLVEGDDNQPEEVDEEGDTDSEENDSTESSPNLYSSAAALFLEQGLIPSLESSDNIKTADDLAIAFKNEIEIQSLKKAQNYIDNLDVDKVVNSRREQTQLESITEDSLGNDLELAKQLIYQDYINQGLSEDRATKLLKKTIDFGEDTILEDAIESLASLKEFQSRQIEAEKLNTIQRLKEQEAEQIRIDTDLKNRIYNAKELVKGLPITKAIQDRVYNSMTEIVAKNPQTGQLENKFMQDRSKDPLDFDTKMYYLYELTNGFKDFKNVINTTKSKATQELEKVLRNSRFEDNGTPDYLQDRESYGGIGSELMFE